MPHHDRLNENYFAGTNTLAYFPSRTVIKYFRFTHKEDGSIDPEQTRSLIILERKTIDILYNATVYFAFVLVKSNIIEVTANCGKALILLQRSKHKFK